MGNVTDLRSTKISSSRMQSGLEEAEGSGVRGYCGRSRHALDAAAAGMASSDRLSSIIKELGMTKLGD